MKRIAWRAPNLASVGLLLLLVYRNVSRVCAGRYDHWLPLLARGGYAPRIYIVAQDAAK